MSNLYIIVLLLHVVFGRNILNEFDTSNSVQQTRSYQSHMLNSHKHLSASKFADPNWNFEQLRKDIRDFMACYGMVGLGVGIVKDSKMIFAEGFGYRDTQTMEPVDSKTLFGIGSCSKAITALTVGQLVDKKKIDFDARVSNYLPGFRMYDPMANEIVTVRDLLAHRTGLPRHDTPLFQAQYSNMTREKLVYSTHYLTPSYPIRQQWQYGNYMYMVAGYLAGKVAGAESWEELVKNRVFNVLGMNNSYPNYASTLNLPNRALPSFFNGTHFVPASTTWDANTLIDEAGPSGSIVSNAEDMSKWIIANLNEYEDSELISKSTLRDIHSPSSLAPSVASEPIDPPLNSSAHLSQINLLLSNTYGLGWGVGRYRSKRFVHHNGGTVNQFAFVGLLPSDNLGVVLMTNTDISRSVWRVSLFSHIADFVLGTDFYLGNITQVCQYPCNILPNLPQCKESSPSPAQSYTPHPNPSEFVGTYTHPAYSYLKFEVNGNNLIMTTPMPASIVPPAKLNYIVGDVFNATSLLFQTSVTLQFNRNSLGAVVAVLAIFQNDVVYKILYVNSKYIPTTDPGNSYPYDTASQFYPQSCAASQGKPGLNGKDGKNGEEGSTGLSQTNAIVAIVVSVVAAAFFSSLLTAYLFRRKDDGNYGIPLGDR